MKVKKILAGILALTCIVSAFSGCSKEGNDGEMVTLKYVMPGPGMQEDAQKVWDAWNAKLQEKLPGVRVEFEVIPPSEYPQKFALALSGREKIDIAGTYTLDFVREVRNGTFAPMDELIEKYGKDLSKSIPDWYMQYQVIDGVTYGIPGHQMAGTIPALCFFKEYADKYLDVEGLTKELASNYDFTEKAYDYLEDMLVKAKADGVTFKSVESLWEMKGQEGINSGYVIPYDPEAEVKASYFYFDDHMIDVYRRNREWYKMGFIREDVLSATDNSNYIGQLNGFPWWTVTYSPGYEDILSEKYGHEVIAIPYHDGYYIPSTNSSAGTSILSASKHKEEAMQVINILQSDKELYNMLVYGIEGEHYKKIGENRIETPTGAQGRSSDKYGLWCWIVGNVELAYDLQFANPEEKNWIFNEVNKSDWRSKLLGFKLDVTEFENELLQVTALVSEYENSVRLGALENWEELLKEWQEKYEIAGGKKIQEEIQKQIDAFLASK